MILSFDGKKTKESKKIYKSEPTINNDFFLLKFIKTGPVVARVETVSAKPSKIVFIKISNPIYGRLNVIAYKTNILKNFRKLAEIA